MAEPLLTVRDLTVLLGGKAPACRAVELDVQTGETLAVVGESGSGKSTLAKALLGLLPPYAKVSGSVRFQGAELIGQTDAELRPIRGAGIALVPQNPLGSLNPAYTIGWQLVEAVQAHERLPRREAAERAAELLTSVGIDNPRFRLRAYPHQLSGGMRQRVVIAMAMAARPALIIADEPTSALDVTVAAQVLDVLDMARAETGAALILITHDLAVVARHADRVLVLHAGGAIETGSTEDVFLRPRRPYTAGLLGALPRIDDEGPDTAPATDRVLAATSLVRHFPTKHGRGQLHAVCDVSMELSRGETLAVVGESGSGKTTLARMVVRMDRPTSGAIMHGGRDISGLRERHLRAYRGRVQMVLQDATAALNPKMSVGALVSEPLRIHGHDRPGRVAELLAQVGLPAEFAGRPPGRLSGGQRQRVAIARALAVEPEVIVLDEPLSALDASVQAEILTLLGDLQRDLGTAYLFISHDLAAVRRIAHRTAVMYLGHMVESGSTADVLSRPAHPYTRALVSAMPLPDPVTERSRTRIRLAGEPPSAVNPPSGCRFRPRCPLYAEGLGLRERTRCDEERPELIVRDPALRTAVACHYFPNTPLERNTDVARKIGRG